MSVDPNEFEAVRAKVEDHDVVIVELKEHLDEISSDFKTVTANIEQLVSHVAQIIAWLQAKPTKVLLVLVIGLFLGPDGVAQVKDIFGL